MFLSSGSWKFKMGCPACPRSGISAGLHTPVASYGQRGTNLILNGPTLKAETGLSKSSPTSTITFDG